MRSFLASLSNIADVRHEERKILIITPEREDLLDRRCYIDDLVNIDR
jgi:hypothetical protein